MSKIRIAYKNHQTMIKTKLVKEEKLNDNEVEVFETRRCVGFIRPKIINEKKIYYTTAGISLKRYLKRENIPETIISIFFKTNEIIKKVEQYGFQMDNLLLETRYIFIHEKTKELSFIYQPIINNRKQENLFPFFEELLSNIILQSEENSSIHELSNCIFKMKYYSTLEMEKTLFQISPNLFQENVMVSSGYSQQLCYTIADYQKVESEKEEKNDFFVEMQEETELLFYQSENDKTCLLKQKTQREDMWVYIIRKITNEKYSVTTPQFRIGKEAKFVDCLIRNNSAVSRYHADIFYKNEKYYLQDHQSTNGTYVNGIRLYEKQCMELHHGDEITLANEKFQIYFEKR